MNTHSKGWNFSNLTHSAAELKQAYHETEPRELTEKTRCIRCSCQMNRPSIIAADAGQAYEELNLPYVYETLDDFYSRGGHCVKDNSDATISVLKTVRHCTRSGGRAADIVNDRVVFWLSKVRVCVESLLAMRFFRLGDRFLVQVKGIPIGGPISGVILDMSLVRLEEKFDRVGWKRFMKKCPFKKLGRRSKYVGAGRYADDTILVSRWLCETCLAELVHEVYSTQVKFDCSMDSMDLGGASFFKVLDFWVCLTSQTVSVTIDAPNESYLWFGSQKKLPEKTKRKTRFPVFEGPKQRLRAALLRDFQGRVARYRQL